MLVDFIPARGLGGEQSSRFTRAPSRALESKPWSNRYQPVILSPWLQPPILMRTTQARLAVSSRPASLPPPSRAGYVACTHLLNSSSCLVHCYSPSFHLAEGLTLRVLENGGIQKKKIISERTCALDAWKRVHILILQLNCRSPATSCLTSVYS